ncbi:hypothetical protein JTE90_007389 [Oedothorax gibbosus]|uniref:Uncharacterized protein n=1 Tax=Oedothorax gibbosus TaxID=931172 RepID=A0AAV6TTY3_9ARAC|nr:hypothetical protein JTE90_007389 [Oedothorax gibbosus]
MYYVPQIGMLVVLLASWILSCQGLKDPDCSKMVFHPKCRGISAKRSSRLPFSDETEDSYNSEDSLEDSYWKNIVDSGLMERIMKEAIYASNFKKHPKSYYDEEK